MVLPNETKGSLGHDATDTETTAFQVDDAESSLGTDSSVPKRETWRSQRDFVISAIGCAVGLGNIWRFPYLCYKYGGGAFLLPYLISVFCVGAPVMLMEIALGQYMSKGVVRAWLIAPGFQGIGLASQVLLQWSNIYYIVVLAWAIYYLVMSFTSYLPWSSCANDWNTDKCFVSGMNTSGAIRKAVYVGGNVTSYNLTSAVARNGTVDAVVEFWERKALRISDGIDQPGGVVTGMALSLLAAWVLVYVCVCKGIRWTGKIVYFTALFPYVLLTALLIRGVTLPGAGQGLLYLLTPDFGKLANSQAWTSAFSQVTFSTAITFGFILTLGSYNKFHFNCVRNSVVVICVNSATSIYGGLAVFSVLGFMAQEQNVSIAAVAESGPGLVFITYPKAVTQMPLSPLWAVLFFFTILLVGIDSQVLALEGFLTPIIDRFPGYLRPPKNRMIFVALYCSTCYLLGVAMVTEGGMYLFQLFDYYGCNGLVTLWICFFEVLVVGWIFGADRFYDALEVMIGYRVSPWLKICWKFIVPIGSMAMFLFYLVTFTPLVYNRHYIYPTGAHVFGLTLTVLPMLCIPGYFIFRLARTPGSIKQRWASLTTPVLHDHQVAPCWKEKGYRWKLVSE